MKTVYNRMFQLWAYSVGHGQVLLRSTKADAASSRIDVAFKDVIALKLPAVFDQLAIEESSAAQVGLPESLTRGHSVWRLRGASGGVPFDGFVVAGAMFGSEDDLEYDDPSRVFSTPP